MESLSAADERAIYPLIKMLRDVNPGVQDAAMRSLISIGVDRPDFNYSPAEKGGIPETVKEEVTYPGRGKYLPSLQGEVVAYMVLPLLREDSYLRNTALIILKEIGQLSVPLLNPLLQDKDDDVRKFCLDLLADIKTAVSPEKILPLLKDPNANVRASAAQAISALQFHQGIPQLIESLKDEEWVTFSVLEAMGELKDERTVAPVAELLSEDSEILRYAAIEALGKIGSPLGVEPLKRFITKNDGLERILAVKSLLQVGITPDMTDLAGVLMKMLESEEWEDKLLAVKGLVALNYEPAVPAIVDLAGSLDSSAPEDENILLRLEDSLIQLGAEDIMMDLLQDDKVRYRGKTVAIRVLGRMKNRKAVPELIEILKSNFRDVRKEGAAALGDIAAHEATPSLLKAIEDHDGHVRKAAVIALGHIEEASTYRPLIELLKREGYRDIQEEIVKAVLHINPSGFLLNLASCDDEIKEIVARFAANFEILLILSRDSNNKVKVPALISLGRGNWGASSQRVLVRLKEALDEEDSEVRKSALISMGELGYCPDEIRLALHDHDIWVRYYAIKAIAAAGREEMSQAIIPLLHDGDLPVVFLAIDTLCQLGGKEAISALHSLSLREDHEIRGKALQALERML